jgi:hypothetical protein
MARPAELMILVENSDPNNDVLEELKVLTEDELKAFEFQEDKKTVTVKYQTKKKSKEEDDKGIFFSAALEKAQDRAARKKKSEKDNLSPIPVELFNDGPKPNAKPAK